ncbi:MAG TPA: 50S ribosomal protein L11 methyltransferase [Longimicrobium sp.]|nr:50S ribosomal protein L11 methyltransferase [Longimicrobium sp.]
MPGTRLAGAERVPRLAHRAYLRAATGVRSSPLVYRLVFGHWPARGLRRQLWDWTTLALAEALRSHVRPGTSVLDVGTGPTGVLAIYARHRLRCGRACGVDHLPDLLPSAVETAARCGAPVEFFAASLFTGVSGRWDLIAFNAPYIPVDAGRRLGVVHDESTERRYTGGPTGMATIERFLRQAPGHLAPGGHILLGVNHFYVTPPVVREAVEHARLREVGTVRHRLTHACAYVLQPRDASR